MYHVCITYVSPITYVSRMGGRSVGGVESNGNGYGAGCNETRGVHTSHRTETRVSRVKKVSAKNYYLHHLYSTRAKHSL
jgi:hypothetical protein